MAKQMTDYRIKVFEITTEKNTFHVYLRKNKVMDIRENGYFVPFQAREMTYLSLWEKIKYAIWEIKWLVKNRLGKSYAAICQNNHSHT